MVTPSRWAVRCLAVLLLGFSPAQAQDAVPVEPIAAILDAFQSHSLVAMSDAHGNVQNHAFRLALIRDPRFTGVVNDIVLELGNALYQNSADRYVRGEEVPHTELRRVWENTVVPTGGTNYLMIEELFRTVRELNSRLPQARQLRILLGDPPIDWDRVRTRDDWSRFLELRDSYPAALIQLEVIAKQRRALILYGHLHFQRKNVFSNYVMDSWQAQTLVSLLEGATSAKVFTVWQLDPQEVMAGEQRWPVPSLMRIRGTALGKADFAAYRATPNRFSVNEGKMIPIPKDRWGALEAQEQFDAILYLGPSATMTESQIPPSLCT